MTERTISVVTANFNHGSLIENAVRSIAQQSRTVLEHIIVDDASTDNSVEIIQALVGKYPSLRLIRNERNIGPAMSCGRALREAKGEYIQFLSADDMLPSNSIAERLSVAEAAGGPALVCGDVGFVDASTGALDHRRYVTVEKPTYFSPQSLLRQQQHGLNVVNGGSALARRDDLLAAKVDDYELRWHCDAFAYNTIAYRLGVWYVPGVQQYFTVGHGNFSKGARDWSRQKLVLARLFALLASTEYSEVRSSFRDSGVIAHFPHVMRYLLVDPRHRDFLTPSLIGKASLYALYRTARSLIPKSVIDDFVRRRTRAATVN
jgi:glycosyltransferase involved in cell wall biosynthesis